VLCSSILLCLQLARSVATPRLWMAKFLPWQPWATHSALLMPLTPCWHHPLLLPRSCVAQATSSLCDDESFGERVLQTPPRAHGSSRHDSTMGRRRGGEKAGAAAPFPSLLGMHIPVTDGCLPPTLRLRQALASLWQDGPRGRDPPAHVSKASSSSGRGTAHASRVWSCSEWQRCS